MAHKKLDRQKENRSIRFLVIDQSESRSRLLQEELKACGHECIFAVHGAGNLLEKVAEIQPDVILIEVESPQRDTLEQLSTIRDRDPLPVVMFSQDPEAQTIQAAVSSGVCAYVVDGINRAQVRPAIDTAMATFSAYEALRDQVKQARTELSEHKRVDRAKAILMNERGLTEEEAHKAIRKLAMDRKRKLQDIADDIIAMDRVFGKRG